MKSAVKIIAYCHSRKCYLIVPVIFLMLFLMSLSGRKLTLFPVGDSGYGWITAYDDADSRGNSEVNEFAVTDTGIYLHYTLHDSLLYPYAGILLKLMKDSSFLDVSSYDEFIITVSAPEQVNIRLYFHTNMPGYTEPDRVLSYRFVCNDFDFLFQEQTVSFPLKSFKTPGWWYFNNNLPENSLKRETFKEVAKLSIQSGGTNQIDQPFRFTVKEISFQRDIGRRAVMYIGMAIAWLLLYFIGYLIIIRRNATDKKVVVSYEPLPVSNDSDDSAQRIIDYMAKQYSNPELTLQQLAWQVGVGAEKISGILKTRTNCGYKQYLNTIRLAEAKRLLVSTDLNITDISNKVGYRNVTHFNRIFKQEEGMSPRTYRNTAENT